MNIFRRWPHYEKVAAQESLEGKKVKPVPISYIEAIQPYVSSQVWAMIQLQLLTGARPGEIVLIKIEDIDRSDEVWIFRPEKHKKDYLDIERDIYMGEKAQAIAARFMFGREPDEYLFSPREANQEAKSRDAQSSRRNDQKPNPKKTTRVTGNKYTVDSYRRAINRACEKAGVKQWSPNQLRHNAATSIRKEYGIEAAQVILGHATADITQVYAERDKEKAITIAKKLG